MRDREFEILGACLRKNLRHGGKIEKSHRAGLEGRLKHDTFSAALEVYN